MRWREFRCSTPTQTEEIIKIWYGIWRNSGF